MIVSKLRNGLPMRSPGSVPTLVTNMGCDKILTHDRGLQLIDNGEAMQGWIVCGCVGIGGVEGDI